MAREGVQGLAGVVVVLGVGMAGARARARVDCSEQVHGPLCSRGSDPDGCHDVVRIEQVGPLINRGLFDECERRGQFENCSYPGLIVGASRNRTTDRSFDPHKRFKSRGSGVHQHVT